MLLCWLAIFPIPAIQRPVPIAFPVTLGAWILPSACDFYPMLMPDRFGNLTRWITTLTPRLLAL